MPPTWPGGPLLCVTPAPAIDRTARVERFAFGTPMRPTDVIVKPGGKGINVARAARSLGAAVATTGFAGGHAGRWLMEQLHQEGLAPAFSPVSAETRTTIVTVDRRGRSTLLYEPAAPISQDEEDQLLRLLADELLPPSSWVTLSGSLPRDRPTLAGRLVRTCRRAQRRVLVDTSGEALRAALAASPEIAKVSRAEVVEAGLLGSRGSARAAAERLVREGAGLGVVTDGGRRVAASDGQTTWEVDVPAIEVVNAVGSGDAFAAGLLVALVRGHAIPGALAAAVGAGCANALTPSAGLIDSLVAERIAASLVVRARRVPGTHGDPDPGHTRASEPVPSPPMDATQGADTHGRNRP